MMKEYIVVFATSDDDAAGVTANLAKQVNEKLEADWLPLGGVSVAFEPTELYDRNTDGYQNIGTRLTMSQAMIKQTIPGQTT